MSDRDAVLTGGVRQPDDEIAENPQRRDGAVGELALVDGVEQAGPQRTGRDDFLEPGGEERRRVRENGIRADRLEGVHHPLADAARRHVDHAPQADVVVRVDDQLQVGERVLDLLALVEPDAADDLVGHRLAHQRVFDRAGLRVGAIEHGDHRIDVVRPGLLDRPGDEVGLLELVVAAEVDDLRAALAIGPQPLVLAVAVLADDGGGGVQDHLRRPVVLFELDRRRFGEVVLEVEDVLAGRRRATCRSTDRGRRRRRGCGRPRTAA